MKKMHVLLTLLFITVLQSCTNNNPRKEFAGDYTVKIELQEGIIPKSAIKDSIQAGLQQAKEALKNAKTEISDDFNLEKIDTSTPEGKIEYAAKAFGKGMAEFGTAMGEFGRSMGELAIGIANGSIDLADNIIKNIKFDVSLLEDGTIKSNDTSNSKFSFDKSTWEIEGKTLYLVDSEKNKEAFKIISKKDDGFVLEKDKVRLVFSKKVK